MCAEIEVITFVSSGLKVEDFHRLRFLAERSLKYDSTAYLELDTGAQITATLGWKCWSTHIGFKIQGAKRPYGVTSPYLGGIIGNYKRFMRGSSIYTFSKDKPRCMKVCTKATKYLLGNKDCIFEELGSD